MEGFPNHHQEALDKGYEDLRKDLKGCKTERLKKKEMQEEN